jgi:hypothetical protein
MVAPGVVRFAQDHDTVALVMVTDDQAAARFTGIGVPSDWLGGGGRF